MQLLWSNWRGRIWEGEFLSLLVCVYSSLQAVFVPSTGWSNIRGMLPYNAFLALTGLDFSFQLDIALHLVVDIFDLISHQRVTCHGRYVLLYSAIGVHVSCKAVQILLGQIANAKRTH